MSECEVCGKELNGYYDEIKHYEENHKPKYSFMVPVITQRLFWRDGEWVYEPRLMYELRMAHTKEEAERIIKEAKGELNGYV